MTEKTWPAMSTAERAAAVSTARDRVSTWRTLAERTARQIGTMARVLLGVDEQLAAVLTREAGEATAAAEALGESLRAGDELAELLSLPDTVQHSPAVGVQLSRLSVLLFVGEATACGRLGEALAGALPSLQAAAVQLSATAAGPAAGKMARVLEQLESQRGEQLRALGEQIAATARAELTTARRQQRRAWRPVIAEG